MDDASEDRPDEDWPDDDWPGEDWPGEDWPGEGPPPWADAAGDRRRRRRSVSLVIVGAAALAVGAGVALAVSSDLLSSSAAPVPSSSPPGAMPGAGQGGAGAGPVTQMFVAGKVVAVSATSITVGGPGRSVTAAVTAATRITGRVTSLRSIRAGDSVSAQITERDGQPVATAIQDPARLPPGAP
jgi:hypothetical protein